MKKIKIYERTVTERTGFRKHPYKEVHQFVIEHDDKVYKNDYVDVNNKKLRIPFQVTLETRNKKDLKKYVDNLGYTKADKQKKEILKKFL